MSNQEYIRAAFEAARNSGKVHTSKDFAELVGVDRATMSNALNGHEKYLSDRLVAKIQHTMEYNAIVVVDDFEELYNILNTTYHIAGIKGYAKNQKEFADYIGISEDTLSRAFKKDPRYLTKNLIARIERKMRDSGMTDIRVIGDRNAVASAPHATASVVADHTAELIAELKEQRIMFSKQIEAQMDIIKNLTQALSRK